MTSYSLTLKFSASDAQAINAAGQKVVLVKSVTGGGSQTAWVTFSPFQTNTLTWSEQYGIYASASSVQAGATIVQSSTVDLAQTAVEYPFKNNVFGSATTPTSWTVSASQYATENDNGGNFTFGLQQAASLNGSPVAASPLNAVTVLNGQHAIFQPHETITVFLQAQVDNGAVISDVSSNTTTIDLTTATSQTATYNPTTGTFVVG